MIHLAVERRGVDGREILAQAIEEGLATLREKLAQRINLSLIEAVTYMLGRRHHVRRGRVPSWLQLAGECQRCHTRQSRRFSRNGYRERGLITRWADVRIQLPRLRCECGGSVRIDFQGWLRPYQRCDEEVDQLIQRWGHLALSLRQIQAELETLYIPLNSLWAINERLHQLQELNPEADPEDVPSVLLIDAFHLKRLRPNGRYRKDRKGRRRPVKGVVHCCLVIAMGIWPESGRQQIIGLALVDEEDEKAWRDFLTQLEAQGVRGENGLELIIHDGGGGLQAALRHVYFGALQQRCLFHKMRNIAEAIELPEDLPPEQRRRQKKAILQDFFSIWQAQRYRTALRRYLAVVRKYRHSQPRAVATLRRDFRYTLTFYTILARHPQWPRRYLRTTSPLERFNRQLRQRVRKAGAYHSEAGILAMAAQEASLWNAAQVAHKISTA